VETLAVVVPAPALEDPSLVPARPLRAVPWGGLLVVVVGSGAGPALLPAHLTLAKVLEPGPDHRVGTHRHLDPWAVVAGEGNLLEGAAGSWAVQASPPASSFAAEPEDQASPALH
jgi:hypothetical protein